MTFGKYKSINMQHLSFARRSVFLYVQVKSKRPRLQIQKQKDCKARTLLLTRQSLETMPCEIKHLYYRHIQKNDYD
jgi:hypothetical protein